jgi:hypothetical protein
MKIIQFKAVHTGEIYGHLSSQVRKKLKISKLVLNVLIREGFVVREEKVVSLKEAQSIFWKETASE